MEPSAALKTQCNNQPLLKTTRIRLQLYVRDFFFVDEYTGVVAACDLGSLCMPIQNYRHDLGQMSNLSTCKRPWEKCGTFKSMER